MLHGSVLKVRCLTGLGFRVYRAEGLIGLRGCTGLCGSVAVAERCSARPEAFCVLTSWHRTIGFRVLGVVGFRGFRVYRV